MLLPYGEAAGEGSFLTWAERSLQWMGPLCEELRERSGVDPEFEPSGALYVARTEDEACALQEKQERLRGRHLIWFGGGAANALEPCLADGVEGALASPREAHLRSPLLVRAYAGAAESLGATIERGVAATSLRVRGDRVQGVETPLGPRDGGCVVSCTGAWAGVATPLALPIEPVRGQILSLEGPNPPLRRIVVGSEAYLVPKRDGSVVVGATEERVGFECRVTADGMSQLLGAAPRLVPALASAGFRHGWAGLRPATPDGLPVIDRAPDLEGLFVAAGHTRNGVLLSPATGRLVADLILGKGLPDDAQAFRATRFAAA